MDNSRYIMRDMTHPEYICTPKTYVCAKNSCLRQKIPIYKYVCSKNTYIFIIEFYLNDPITPNTQRYRYITRLIQV